KALEKDTSPSTGVCAIGFGGPRLLYYFQGSLYLPRNWEEFEQFRQSYAKIKCAAAMVSDDQMEPVQFGSIVSNDQMESVQFGSIAAFLAREAKTQMLGDIVIYTYPR
ncbi:MAG TPA: hypothetical protein VIV15_06765, partial [Anaerolineales bacterium]